MKKSIKHLPRRSQQEIELLLKLMTDYGVEAEMIILYGSFARKDYVLFDVRNDFGSWETYQSDYDLLVVVSEASVVTTERRIDRVVDAYYRLMSVKTTFNPPQIIIEHINTLNKQLEYKQYFFTDVVKEGIMLYNRDNFELAKPRELDFREIREIAEDEFKQTYSLGADFYDSVREYLIPTGKSAIAAFSLHQACEKFYKTIEVVYTNYKPKGHDLIKLNKRVRKHSVKLRELFPEETEFEKRCFHLLYIAYVEARYNPAYSITAEELDYLVSRVKILKELTDEICRKQIDTYSRLILC